MSQTLVKAKVNLLDNDGKFETGKNKIESDLGSIAARSLRVVMYKCLSCEAAWKGCGTPTIFLKFDGIRGINPIS